MRRTERGRLYLLYKINDFLFNFSENSNFVRGDFSGSSEAPAPGWAI